MSPSEWLRQVKLLAAIWPNQPLPEETITEWGRMLREFTVESVEQAIHKLAKTAEMRPSIAEIVEQARYVIRDQRMSAAGEYRNLPPARDVADIMAESKAPYVRLLAQLWREYQSDRVPSEDYFRLTSTSDVPGYFHNGRATQLATMELTQYLDLVRAKDEEADFAAQPQEVTQ